MASERLFGLVGFPLTHSFSKKYFTEKFEKLNLSETHRYELFEMENLNSNLTELFDKHPELEGINVTIPHKQAVFPFMNELDISARNVGAVNVVKRDKNGKLTGYNSDYYGFRRSLLEFLGDRGTENLKALLLGYGGAGKAVRAVLKDLGIETQIVSRRKSDETVSYEEADHLIDSHHLIINCTPLGTYPKTEECPEIDYKLITLDHFLFDLVYNPTETLFLKKGLEKGAAIKNGYDMLVYQAEKSWEIWNNNEENEI
jgi:shikimate dehydrogenase